ncbi:DUF3667 domain-containing protein [Sphingosinicella sp. LHD-64]|uniref:DUF3667 domain-containing protein n=1 Tax=Sphingosinicella sp. LHD-64 TaxID=3072139 RepID=UPI0028104499|nr:DUF3667 domain-containing protein [Sphingosinicella sp. LHD-64]MDQ8756062.1 DUF3667 domain-containing protein [Sphingosinicella sp. LHD-64]
MSGIEGVGEAVTGGMFARTVEPEAGEATQEAEGNCLNCGAGLTGAYCRRCGQKGHVHRTISAIGHDLIHGILHLDGKFWRTLPMLAWRPGELTRRYVHGERAKFVSPLGMFLFAIFLMFAILQIYGLSLTSLSDGPLGAARGVEMAEQGMAAELARAQESRREWLTERRDDGRRAERVARYDRRIAELQQGRQALAQLRRSAPTLNATDDGVRTGWARLDSGLKKINQNPGLALYKLQANGYKFSWLLIPISVPFVWLLFFWTRRFRFYDHTVFVTYSLAFMSLLAIVLTILGFAGVPTAIIATAGTFIPPIHMYRQLKQAYSLGWVGALVRTFLLVNFCFVTASLFFVLLLGIGALG